MKFTYNWLKDFLGALKIPPQELADKLTMAGIEVKSIERAGEDFVFEVEITSNRPDWLGVVGIAREVAALTGKTIAPSKENALENKTDPAYKGFKINIEDKKDCPLYNASIITGVSIKPSPAWLQKRLESIGCRSINNVVDVTNYCMYTWGQPLHAFDLDTLEPGSIGVRRAKSQEKLVTIDAETRILDNEVLVICDRNKPVALAGVMGGKDTEVSDKTINILLEAAIFDPLVVRRGRRKLGIQSDASYRFERTVDRHHTEEVARKAITLIQEVAGGSCGFFENSNRLISRAKTVVFDIARVQKILGVDSISMTQAKKYLHGLGFLARAKTKTVSTIMVPSFRPDVSSEADIIEEIARVHGYAAIPATLPTVRLQEKNRNERATASSIKHILVSLGLQEVITYSLLARDLLEGFEECGQGVEVLNPLSKEQEILRPTLLPSLIKCVATNLNQKKEYIALFEIADTFIQPSENRVPVEEPRLAVVLCGERLQWLSDRPAKDKAGFLHLKGVAESLFKELGISSYAFSASKTAGQFDVHADNKKIGILCKLDRSLLEAREIKNKDVYALEISLHHILSIALPPKHYKPLPRYPSIQRDISIAVREETRFEKVMELIVNNSKKLIQEIEVIDSYKGEHIEHGYKGLTISCRYASLDRTLTEAEINPVHEAIVRALIDTLGAKIR